MKARYIIVALVVLVVGALALVLTLATRTAPLPPVTLPSPNGYEDLLRASQAIVGQVPDIHATLSAEELRPFVASNATAFALLETGLSRECRVPVEYSMDYVQRHVPEIGGFKALVVAAAARANLAEQEGHPNEAVREFLQCTRAAHAVARGGFMIDALVGSACEAIGNGGLSRVLPHLDAATAMEVVKTLERLDASAETVEAVLVRENHLARVAYGWSGSIAMVFHGKQMEAAYQKFEQKVQDSDRRRRLLMIAVAGRAFEVATGKPPRTVEDLVPQYLSAAPKDPRTGTALEYAFAP